MQDPSNTWPILGQSAILSIIEVAGETEGGTVGLKMDSDVDGDVGLALLGDTIGEAVIATETSITKERKVGGVDHWNAVGGVGHWNACDSLFRHLRPDLEGVLVSAMGGRLMDCDVHS